MKIALGIIICGSLGLQAQTWEVHAFALRQTATAEGDFPQTTYNLRGIAFARDIPRKSSGAQLQYTFAFAASPSEKASYHTNSTPPTPYGGQSGSYSPGGFISAGINFQTPGAFRVGLGLEGRLGIQRRFGSSGDTGGGEDSFILRPWANLHVRYSPTRSGLAPVFGFHVGVPIIQLGADTDSVPAPNREASLFAGLRF